jgi:hypothetical protein
MGACSAALVALMGIAGCGFSAPVATPDATPSVAFCPPTTTWCGDACVDTSRDPQHCGGCGQTCTDATPSCASSVCVGQCGVASDPSGSPDCPAECTGGCTADNVCVIDCNGTQKCFAKMMACPPGYACEVRCTGDEACDGNSIVQCPDGPYACALICEQHDGCADLIFQCAAGPCSVNCGSDPEACEQTTVRCGTGSCGASCTGTSQPAVDCASACGCQTC